MQRTESRQLGKILSTLTVDGDGNALGKSIAVLTEEGRNLSELAGLLVLSSRVASLGLDDLEIETVRLRHGKNAGGAGVLLRGVKFGISNRLSMARASRRGRGEKRKKGR